ncbi:MAG: NmrA family NAD(P)-binding protein, partial [Anaerolineae bacterium]|nr:NmrA family NAD(P)-binding protein [Anaerolineae bacterium]
MILVTGAGGKTGKAIIAQLVQRGYLIRGFVRSQKSALEITELGAKQAVIGDMLVLGDVINAMDGIQSVYHICPNVHPQEQLIGKNIITAALHHSAEHLVYHSVLHPQIESMPHHWEKMRVEEMIFASGLNFTILQPTAYMQNILGQ